jgi:hypothetical protein
MILPATFTHKNTVSKLPAIGLVVFGFFAALVIGFVAGTGSTLLMLAIGAMVAVMTVLFLPPTLMLWMLCVVTFLVTGPAMYFLKFESARWFPPLIAASMLLTLAFAGKENKRGSSGVPAYLVVFSIFLISLIFSTIISDPNMGEMLTGWRNYFAYWPVMLVVMYGLIGRAQLSKVWWFLIGMVFIQLPFVVYQHYFAATKSLWSTSWDAVVGSFPGNEEASGASGAMGLFVLCGLVVAISLWKKKLLNTWLLVLLSLVVAATIALAEVKAVVLMAPVAVGLIYYRELISRPIRSLFMVIISVGLSVLLIFAYSALYYDDINTHGGFYGGPMSPVEAIENQFDPYSTSLQGHELSRTGLLQDWWGRNVLVGDVQHSLFGHGINATRSSRLGLGELINKLPYGNASMTGTSVLLWEAGIFGHVIFVLGALMAAYASSKLSRLSHIPAEHQALLSASAIVLLLLTLALPYKGAILETPPTQFLFAFVLGYVGYWWRSSKGLPVLQ